MKEIYLIYKDGNYLNEDNKFSELNNQTAFFNTYESANDYAKNLKDVYIRNAFIGLGEFYNAN